MARELSLITGDVRELKPEDYGPRMLALTEKQRRFVLAMLSNPGGSNAAWAREAGYEADDAGLRRQGWENRHKEEVLAALKEMSDRMVRSNVGVALAAMDAILADPFHKNHFDAVKFHLAYSGIAPETVSRVVHELDLKSKDRSELLDEIRVITEKLSAKGLDIPRLLDHPVTDAEFAPVEDATAALDRDWSV